MKLLNTSYIEIKKSKFYGYLYELDSIEDVKIILNNLKEENKGYRHIPYAYYFNNTAGKSDDKEPGNISISFLNNLERNNLNNQKNYYFHHKIRTFRNQIAYLLD